MRLLNAKGVPSLEAIMLETPNIQIVYILYIFWYRSGLRTPEFEADIGVRS
jgi:hypothetical protein